MSFWNKDNCVGILAGKNPIFLEELGVCIHHVKANYIPIIVVEEILKTIRVRCTISVKIQDNLLNFSRRRNNCDHDIGLIIHQNRNGFLYGNTIMQNRRLVKQILEMISDV